MKRKKKRKEKKRNVNELKSQPSAKQSNTRRLLASNVLEIPTSSASPTIRGLSYASPETPVRDTLATPETRSILVETWSKIFRSRKKKKRTSISRKRRRRRRKRKKENDLEKAPSTRPLSSDLYTQGTHLSRGFRSDSTQHVTFAPRGVKRAPTVRVHGGSRHCQSRSNHRDARSITRTISHQILRRDGG